MPLERVFLDTNIVCNLNWILSDATFEDGFYNHVSHKFVKTDMELRRDCMALRYLIEKDDQFALQFVVSTNVIAEIQQTPPAGKRDKLLSIVNELATHFENQQKEYLGDSDLPPLSPSEQVRWVNFYECGGLDFLPHKADQRLILDSILQRCHFFLTLDRKSIWNFRHQLLKIGIKVKRPLEYLQSFMFPLNEANLGFLGTDDILNIIDCVCE